MATKKQGAIMILQMKMKAAMMRIATSMDLRVCEYADMFLLFVKRMMHGLDQLHTQKLLEV